MPHHLDGREEHNHPANLLLVCRSCNARAGAALRRAGLGRLTRQYNPSPAGAQTLAEWVQAARTATGQLHGKEMPLARAVAIVQATPPSRRTAFAKQIWEIRRDRGTDKPSAPPF